MKHLRLFAFTMLAAAGLFVGCSPPGTTTPAVSAQVLPTESPAELLRLSGSGAPYTSAPLQFSDEVTLLVHWQQSSTDEFSFVIAPATAPEGSSPVDEVMFELAIGPSSGSGEAGFSAGDYVLKVTAADGPWLIWIETIEVPQDVN